MEIQVGDTVRCLAGNIDRNHGSGMAGTVTGFARFSSYHPREAFVRFGDNHRANGWFWLSSLKRLDED